MNRFTGPVAAEMGCKTYGIRPEHITLDADKGLWKGTVRHLERLGADAIVHLDVRRLRALLARTSGDITLLEGATVWASPMLEKEIKFSE